MASTVFYRFKNQKEPDRITFDGTGISVFELKRDIINAQGLSSQAAEFDFHLYHEDNQSQAYDDDLELISRGTTVVCARRPAARGHGRAQRYVTGRAPVRALKRADAAPTVAVQPAASTASEADATAAFFAEDTQAWAAQKETLAHAKPVYNKSRKQVNVPDHEPPPGYVCYRCGNRGHWIQQCPTNDDPDFKPTTRAKRTTGIPQSFLKKISKPVEGDLEDARGIMLNADGEYVQVMTDNRAWEKFQEKANATKAKAATVEAVNKEVRERGLECPIDKRMFVDPVKTPCCNSTYCHECIETALADGDLVCPKCSTEGVLIDDLVTDSEMVEKIRAFEAEQAKHKLVKEQQEKEAAKQADKSPSPQANTQTLSVNSRTDEKAPNSEINRSNSKSPQQIAATLPSSTSTVKSALTVAAKPDAPRSVTPGTGGNGSDTDTSTTSKKRKEAPTDVKPPTAPKAMRLQNQQQAQHAQDQASSVEKQFIEQMEALKNGAMPNMPMPNMPMNPNMSMSMGMPMNPMMGMMNPSHMNGMNNYGNNMGQWNGYNQGYPNNMGYQNMGYQNNAYGNMPYSNGMNQNNYGGNWGQQGFGGFPNQQRNIQSQQPNDAYERQPLNPHRAQNKHRKQRAPDYHYV